MTQLDLRQERSAKGLSEQVNIVVIGFLVCFTLTHLYMQIHTSFISAEHYDKTLVQTQSFQRLSRHADTPHGYPGAEEFEFKRTLPSTESQSQESQVNLKSAYLVDYSSLSFVGLSSV